MYDITRYSSLRNFQEWLAIFKKGYSDPINQVPIIMVGSKLDLEHKRAVSKNDAYELAKENGLIGYIECSSKDGQNVEEVFTEIGRLMMNNTNFD